MAVAPVPSRISRALVWMGKSWAAWTAVFLIDTGLWVLVRVTADDLGATTLGSAIRRAVVVRAAGWYGWWLLSPAVFFVATRFHVEPGARVRSTTVHIVAALLASAASNTMVILTLAAMGMLDPSWSFRRIVAPSSQPLLTYVVVVVVALWRAGRERERGFVAAKAQLETQLALARHQALTAQLRPHFLYNALNGVAMLMRAKAHDAALRTMLGYSELLRTVLSADTSEVPLRRELAFIDRYLAVERMRFPERLAAHVTEAGDVGDALVPNLILQPLVENALHHGLRDVETGAVVEILASRRDGMLHLEVHDNGAGLPLNWRMDQGSGVGLRNTQARLRLACGSDHHFELHSPPEGGTVVILEMPYRTASGPAHRG